MNEENIFASPRPAFIALPYSFIGFETAMFYNDGVLQHLKSRANSLKAETYAVYLAARDSRTPWLAKGLVLLVVAYAVSPIDLIPDFVPVFGYLDDLIIVSAGIALALRLIPPEVMATAREAARTEPPGRGLRIAGASIMVLVWILAIVGILLFIRHLLAIRL
jgi:uncharacterized membrane protein YkvA (DUF1232 family)